MDIGFKELILEIYQILIFKNCVFLITTMYCYEMILKLENILADYDVDCYIYPIMSMMVNNKRSDLISPVRKDIIPKTIHYCWLEGTIYLKKTKNVLIVGKRYAQIMRFCNGMNPIMTLKKTNICMKHISMENGDLSQIMQG